MYYRELFMPSMILSKKGHDFYFINSFLTKICFVEWWVGYFIFFPQTSLAFLTLILVYYCLYFKLYVRRDALSCQSALSGFGSHFLAPLGIFIGQFPLYPIFFLSSLINAGL